jgi:hypothetical protein
MTQQPLRWGIVSAGKISNDFTCGLSTLPANEHKVVAVAARSEKSSKEFAKHHDIPKSYGSYAELAQDSDVGECVCTGILFVKTLNCFLSAHTQMSSTLEPLIPLILKSAC